MGPKQGSVMEEIQLYSWKVLAQEKGGGKVVAEYIFAAEDDAYKFHKDMAYKGYLSTIERIKC